MTSTPTVAPGPSMPSASDDGPAVSVVLLARRFAHVADVLACWAQQEMRDAIEIVLVTESASALAPDADRLASFRHVQVLPVGPFDHLADAMAYGIRHARAPLVIWGEDHAFPAPDLIRRILARAAEPWAALGPAILNANPSSPISWAMLLTSYTDWIESESSSPARDLPGHNSCYRRDVLLALGDELAARLRPLGGLHARLLAAGGRLELDGSLRVAHLNPSRRTICMTKRWQGARTAMSLRIARGELAVWERLLLLALWPVNAARRLRWALRAWSRVRPHELRCATDARRHPATLAWVTVFATLSAAGEASAVLVPADTDDRFIAEFELDRSRVRARGDVERVLP